METDVGLKSRVRENCKHGSVRGSRQAFHIQVGKECRDCLLDDMILMKVNCEHRIKEDIGFMMEAERINTLERSEATGISRGLWKCKVVI